MPFKVVEGGGKTKWVPASYGSGANTFYIGQLVTTQNAAATSFVSNGVVPLGAAVGAIDTTDKKVPVGVVVGIGIKSPSYDSTYKALTVTSVASVAAQAALSPLHVGSFPKYDGRVFLEIEPINAETIIQGTLYQSTFGTALSARTATAVNATAGLGFTTATVGITPTANMHSWYCRSGANKGLTRAAYDASATAHTFYTYWPKTLAIGDVFTFAPFKEYGPCYMQIDAAGMFVDGLGDYATNYYGIFIERLNLSKVGQETIDFRFNSDHFGLVRA